MEGRDIGTVVFPRADVKIYLDASAEERARRRALDPAHRLASGRRRSRVGADRARPQRPHPRGVASLRRADAVLVDTTGRRCPRSSRGHGGRSGLRPSLTARGSVTRLSLSPSLLAPIFSPCSPPTRPGRAPSGGGPARSPCRSPAAPRCPGTGRPAPCRCRRRCPGRGWGCRRPGPRRR